MLFLLLFFYISPYFDTKSSFGSMVCSLLSFLSLFLELKTQKMLYLQSKQFFAPLCPPCSSAFLSFSITNFFPLGPVTLPSSTFSLPYHSELTAISEQSNQLTSNRYYSIHCLFCSTLISWMPWFSQLVHIPKIVDWSELTFSHQTPTECCFNL